MMSAVSALLVLQTVLGGVGTALSSLSRLVPTTTGRAAVTFAIGLTVMALLARADRLHEAKPPRVPKTAWHLAVTFGTMFIAATAGIVIVAVWGLSSELLAVFTDNLGPGAIVRFGVSVLFLIGAYTMTGLIRQLVEEIAKARGSLGEHEREIAFRVGQVTLYLISLLLILSLWRVNIGGILVGAGFLGIVVGMAARQTLGALIAGFVLMFSRPFEIGDWIEVGENEGIVTDITIVNTRIQTFDGEYVMVPNDVVSSKSLINRSRKGRLRIEVEIGVDYEADPEYAAEVAKDAVVELDDPMNVPTPQVVLKRFDDSAIVLGVRYWIGNPSARRRWRSKTAVIGAVKRAFEAEDIKIPFPQREMMGREETGGFVLAGERSEGGEQESADSGAQAEDGTDASENADAESADDGDDGESANDVDEDDGHGVTDGDTVDDARTQ